MTINYLKVQQRREDRQLINSSFVFSIPTASENHFIEIRHSIHTDFYIEDVHLSDEFLVVPGLSEAVIIGAATMQKWRIKLDFENDRVIVDPKVAKLQLI